MTVASRDPAEAVAALREALRGPLSSGNPVRNEGYWQAISADVLRLAQFGVEDTFAQYSARDLASSCIVAGGTLSDVLLRIAYTRAVAEDDADLLAHLDHVPSVGLVSAWRHDLEGLDRAAMAERAVAPMPADDDGEERTATRLIAARRFPDLAQPAWLWEVPPTMPALGHALASTFLRVRPDLYASVASYLVERRATLLHRDPDALLARLVAVAGEHPQTVLVPFEGFYGEQTQVAAAEWHLEHDEPAAALTLASTLRPLSAHAARAALVASLAALALQKVDDARHFRALIDEPLLQAIATVRFAEAGLASESELAAAIGDLPVAHAELFYRGVLCLLNRRNLALARSLCARRQADFAGHPQLGPIIAKVLGG